jgi:hypothetical protein
MSAERVHRILSIKGLPEWLSSAPERNLANSGIPGKSHPPFQKEIFEKRQYLGEGDEQVVYGFPQDSKFSGIVIKESKQHIPKVPTLLVRAVAGESKFIETFNSWQETAGVKQQELTVMSEIFGPYMLPTRYIHGYASDESGRTANYCVQQRIEGRDFSTYMMEDRKSVHENPKIREQLLDIVWASKKAFIELGATPDFDKGQNMYVTNNEKIVLNDPSIFVFLSELANNNDMPFIARRFIAKRISNEVKYIKSLERELQPTSEESNSRDKAFFVSESAFEEKMDRLKPKIRFRKKTTSNFTIVA